jgi:AraC-like DNA-binding protein
LLHVANTIGQLRKAIGAFALNEPPFQVFRSYHHTPGGSYGHLFHSVLRAGHARVRRDFPLENAPYPGHDLILCLSGSGTVKFSRRTFTLQFGDLCWIDYRQAYVSWPARLEPWEFMWVKADSPQMDLLSETLNVENNAVFPSGEGAEARSIFHKIFELLEARPLAVDAALHGAVGSLVGLFFQSRQSAASGQRTTPREAHATDLSGVLEAIRADYQRKWTVAALAKLAHMSEPHFFRRFAEATGSSPISWLRRERVNQAKHRLTETSNPIQEIAEEVGYTDAHYFSRDFKKLVGVSPQQYRRQMQMTLPE